MQPTFPNDYLRKTISCHWSRARFVQLQCCDFCGREGRAKPLSLVPRRRTFPTRRDADLMSAAPHEPCTSRGSYVSQKPSISSRFCACREAVGTTSNRALRAVSAAPPAEKGAALSRGPSLGQCLSGLLQVLGCRCVGLRLQPMQIIGGLLHMAGGGEDRPLIVFQDFQPNLNIGGVVVAGLRRDAKIGA
jgi:hypothetical protein